MGENELKEDGEEVAIPLAPGQPAIVYDPLEEPRYGWVVCIAMHLINGFTWGIIAVGSSLGARSSTKANIQAVLWSIPVILHQP